MNNVETYLERPVSFTTAAKKVAAIRGHEGRVGGWIYTSYGLAICQGWQDYGKRCFNAGLIAQDPEHNGGNGKWYVPVLSMSEKDYHAAMKVFAHKR